MLWHLFTETEKIVSVILVPFSILYILFSHELSHLFIAYLAKWKIQAFKPYPHKNLNDGEWIGGAIYYEHSNKNMQYMPIMCCIPLWKSFIMSLFWLVISFKFYLPLVVFMIVEVSDYMSWWVGYWFRISDSDGWLFRYLRIVQKKKE